MKDKTIIRFKGILENDEVLLEVIQVRYIDDSGIPSSETRNKVILSAESPNLEL